MLYDHQGKTYVALTNRCPVACRFCVKNEWGMKFRGHDLRVDREPEGGEVLEAVKERMSRGPVEELVFCGFGECSYRLDAVSLVGLHMRLHHRETPVRLNTIGLADVTWGPDALELLLMSVDSVSVSLNTDDETQWEELHRPAKRYQGGFPKALDFARRCAASGLDTRVTAVELPEVDLGRVSALARSIGATFASRPLLSDG